MGRGNSPEISGTEPCVVHLYYDHVPGELRSVGGTARTKWVFISAFATTKEEALHAYIKGQANNIYIYTYYFEIILLPLEFGFISRC